MRLELFAALIFLCPAGSALAQQEIPLYGGRIPNSKPVPDLERSVPNSLVDTVLTGVSVPTLTIFLPPGRKVPGPAVIICPGGGYHALLIKREGYAMARAFNKAGIAAFVLKYRLPAGRTMKDKSLGPLQDAQQAIKTVRERAEEWGIDPGEIGIMGFSAGGHLAAMAGTHFDQAFIGNPEKTSLRPDFMLLINPVISFTDSIGHAGSRENLLGPEPSGAQIRFHSAELQAGPRTPPAFLVHSGEDSVVPSANSLYFYKALRKHGIPAALHLYGKGEHGFLTAPPFGEWFGRCLYWLGTLGR
ncbi:MAG TPA: alpha/beta hydrolase [Anseongella sp.]|nr:alpha/beta hydrolase [Anseongella sp.]